MDESVNMSPFEKSLRHCCFRSRLQGRTKAAILEEMVDALVADRLVADRDGVLEAVRHREEQMSTGMQAGIALPHGKHSSVRGLVTMVALHPGGIDFEAIDGELSRIFVMTLSPPETIGPHLQFLASVGRLLGRPAVREAVLAATDKAALLHALHE